MKLNSWKKSILIGILCGAISYALYMLLLFGVSYLNHWQSYWNYTTLENAGKVLSWNMVVIIGVILSSLVPIICLRFEKIRFVFGYILCSLLAFLWLYGMTNTVAVTFWQGVSTPLSSWDSLMYLLVVFPVGSVIGTIAAFALHLLNKD